MRITRKTNITVEIERKFIVRGDSTLEILHCGQCGEKMISVFMSVDLFGFSSRIIYRLIESGTIHFLETEIKEIYICPLSVKKVLKNIQS